MRLAPAQGRSRLAVRGVPVRPARHALGAAGRLGHRRTGTASRARPGPARPGQPGQRGGRPCCRRIPRRRCSPGTAADAPGHLGGRPVRLLLAKNPAGWLEAFDVLAPPPGPVMLAVNAQGPDGRDTSWLWDVDYRVLRGRPVLVGGERRLDLAVRLEADQVAFDLIDGVDDALSRIPPGRMLDVLANYTAFQQVRAVLGRAE